MAKQKLKEDTLYTSGQKPRSSILNSTFVQRLNAVSGGFRTLNKSQAQNEIEKNYNLRFVRVDLNNPAYKTYNAALGSTFKSSTLSKNLEKYFDSYLQETNTSYDDIQDRQARINDLTYMYYNDAFIKRAADLSADEATQLDVQDRLISIDSPNANFVEKTYSLMNSWGITQTRVRQACFNIELYGEAFWAHKVTMNGVEKIKPLPVSDIMERLEFSPTQVAKFLAERDGWQEANKDRGSKIKKLVDLLQKQAVMDESENLADMFDDKLLGYELHDGIIAPPWLLTHFRYNAENVFYPYGWPPLLGCLSGFKRLQSTLALQGLARLQSFPVRFFKVKSTDGMLPAQAFDIVNQVREQYGNLGVSAASESSEAYTVNTEIWAPEGLLELETQESKVDFDFLGDVENYQDQLAISAGVPKGYLDQEFNGFGESGIALTKQYKPFARHVFSIQSAFLEGLGELIRLHYAITGEFDYNTPFVLSMNFPAEEDSEVRRNAQTATIELSQAIIELIQKVLGIAEDEPLPEDVVTDILSKYSFLDPTDIQKWMRLSQFLKGTAAEDDEGGDDDDFGIDDFGGGGEDFGGGGGDDFGGDEGKDTGDMPESLKHEINRNKTILRERAIRQRKLREQRLQEIKQEYKEQKASIYMKFIESQHFQEFMNTNTQKHCLYIPKIIESSPLWETYQVLADEAKAHKANPSGYDRIKEAREYSASIKDTKPDKTKELFKSLNKRRIEEAIKDASKNSRFDETHLVNSN